MRGRGGEERETEKSVSSTKVARAVCDRVPLPAFRVPVAVARHFLFFNVSYERACQRRLDPQSWRPSDAPILALCGQASECANTGVGTCAHQQCNTNNANSSNVERIHVEDVGRVRAMLCPGCVT